MNALFRDAPLGQMVRWATKGKVFKYPEELPGFQCPNAYSGEKSTQSPPSDITPVATSPLDEDGIARKDLEKVQTRDDNEQLDKEHHLTTAPTAADADARSLSSGSTDNDNRALSQIMSRPQMSQVVSRADIERAYTNAERQETLKSKPTRIEPQKTSDGIILVDWYTTDDPENPQNWTSRKKIYVVVQIYLYTLAVYIGSAIITPGQPYFEKQFGISPEVASLGLSMYVFGYGLGPLLFSPMSEIPLIGRNPPYMVTFGIFVAISIGVSTVNSFPALIVLRFLQGFFGSPCLATGGASLGDVYSLLKLPYALTGWAAFATAGPALGPIISGFSVPKENWHWSLWEITWLAGPVFILLLTSLPETSAPNILLRRAQRLRKATGNDMLRSQSEIDQSKLTVNEVIVQNLWRPLQINIQDPSVLFTSLYIGLMYGIFYSFFEVFPFVYATGLPRANTATHGYGMNAGEIGLIFLSISVGVSIAITIYVIYLKRVFEPDIRANGLGAPERRLTPGLPACFLVPIGLFMFGWTGNSSPKIHWIVPTLGVVIIVIGIFIIFQVVFIYLALTYPQYSASLFAANDFVRSSLGCGAIHFSRPLFINLGVGKGVSLLAGLSCIGVIGMFTLNFYGGALRARSKFAAK